MGLTATVAKEARTFVTNQPRKPADFCWFPQDAAARGKPLEDIPLHSCTCPPCFTEYMNNGKMECVPKCSLDTCEQASGVCQGGFGGAGGGFPSPLPPPPRD